MMRERLIVPGDEESKEIAAPESAEFERHAVESHLEGPHGEHEELSVGVSLEDGKLRGINFWDLDKTLLLAEPIHAAAVNRIFPEQARDEKSRAELHKVYFAGFKLGNSFREWDRMWRIYGEGQTQYKDPAAYRAEFMGKDNPKQRLIDEAGTSEHERANEILQRYGKIAYGIMEEEYKKDPKGFEKKFVMKETMDLLEKKTRIGQANVYMTANQKDFARGLVAFSGLYKYGLALATDETMEGGGKEVAIRKLIEELDGMGLKVNKKRAAAFGDSFTGDVGSGAKEGLGSGVLIVETTHDVDAIIKKAEEESAEGEEARSILRGTVVEAIATKEVKKNKYGQYKYGKLGAKK